MHLVVLSPHLDDATFSLALSLKLWSSCGVSITVVNFFTQSAYAPYAPAGADISSLRAAEDRRSVRAVDPQIRLRSLSLLDAPLRLPIDFGSITNPAVFSPAAEEVEHMSTVIRRICRGSLAIAPLGLGEHIDHRTIRDAAVAALPWKSVAFYEDLPYANWTSESKIRDHVSSLEAELMTPLASHRQRSRSWRFKNRAVRKYHSQIDDSMAISISRYGEKYKGAERIWMPRHSGKWRALLMGITRSAALRSGPLSPRAGLEDRSRRKRLP